MCKSVLRSTQKDVDFECLILFKCKTVQCELFVKSIIMLHIVKGLEALVYGRVPAYFEESVKKIHLVIIIQHFYCISIIYI